MKKLKAFLCLLLCVLIALCSVPITSASSVSTKTLLLNGSWKTDSMTSTNTEDSYKFTVSSDGLVTLKIMHYMPMYISLYNYDYSLTIVDEKYLGGGTSSSPITDTSTLSLTKGTYYIKLGTYNKTGTYKVNGTLSSYGCTENEPNNFDNVSMLSTSTTMKGCIANSDDSDDWYKIYVPISCEVQIKIRHYMSTYVSLYNYDLSTTIIDDRYIGNGSHSSPKTDTLSFTLSKGYYYIKLSAYSHGKYELSWSMKINVDSPDDFMVISHSTTKVKLKWDAVSCDGYQLYQKIRESWIKIASTKNTSYTVGNLTPGVKHIFKVRAYKAYNGNIYYSKWSNVVVTCTKPNKVTIKSLKSTSYGSVTVKWKKVKCSGYHIQISRYKNFSSVYNFYNSGEKNTTKNIYGFGSKEKCYVRVRAYKEIDYNKYYGSFSNKSSIKAE